MKRNRVLSLAGIIAALSLPLVASQKSSNVAQPPPASPQAKKHLPASHVTQGTISSIDANQLVLDRKGRGKDVQMIFRIDGQTQRTGNLTAGSRVSVQYREENKQNVASAVREVATKSAAKPAKAGNKPGSKG